eukprot:scaffold1621_cov350-Prasinococcus_capsulatus_cf.AAC.25
MATGAGPHPGRTKPHPSSKLDMRTPAWSFGLRLLVGEPRARAAGDPSSRSCRGGIGDRWARHQESAGACEGYSFLYITCECS